MERVSDHGEGILGSKLEAKIADADLVGFLQESGSRRPLSVIVELAGPRTRALQRSGFAVRTPRLPRAATKKPLQETGWLPGSLGELLRGLDTVELPSARAIVVRVTPRLLREILALPEVVAVRRNRARKAFPPPA